MSGAMHLLLVAWFSWQAVDLRATGDFGRRVVGETNLSTNEIRDKIKRLLSAFSLLEKAFTVYLRGNRDAGYIGETP